MVPTFTLKAFDGVGVQLCPCNIATVTPQAFTMASRHGETNRPKSSPHQSCGCALRPSPDPSGSS